MTFTDKLDKLMAARRITRGKLADITGIPYNTIVGFYSKGYHNMKLSNLRRIADYFGVSIDMLIDDSRGLVPEANEISGSGLEKKYSALSYKSRSIVDDVINGLLEIEQPKPEISEEEEAKIEYIKEYVTPAAAGYASPAEGEDYILVPKDESAPKNADFAVRIDGDSMEPYIMNGSRVYVTRDIDLKDGDVGIFFVDGNMKCKQYCEDSLGNIYLFSLNRRRRDADVTIRSDSGITVFCFGRVILPKRPPLPN